MLYGGIAGDIIGSRFEGGYWDLENRDFELFTPQCIFTDDTVLTIAVAESLLDSVPVKECLARYAIRYPDAGYGGSFIRWSLGATGFLPYNSWGNGSAMRVGPVAYAARDLEDCLSMAKEASEVTHNHPEGIKGAQATAVAMFMARRGSSKEEIRDAIASRFGYDLKRRYDDIQPGYSFDVSCQGSVPESIICFLESTSWEDTVRRAVFMGGDTDTMACIAGNIAECFYGPLNEEVVDVVRGYLPEEFIGILARFEAEYGA